jgi:hypothetical protein
VLNTVRNNIGDAVAHPVRQENAVDDVDNTIRDINGFHDLVNVDRNRVNRDEKVFSVRSRNKLYHQLNPNDLRGQDMVQEDWSNAG